MSNFDDQQFQQKFDDLLKSLDKLVYNLDPKNNKNKLPQGNWAMYDKKTNSSTVLGKTVKAHSALKTGTDAVTRSFQTLASGSDGLMRAFKDLAEIFVLGKAFTALIDGGERLGQTYSKLSSIGQTFGGSMIQMALQAAQAGVPLGVFTELLMRQSTAAAVMATNTGAGAVSMGTFAKNVKTNLKQFGYYGMTVEDINNLTADYAETLRKQNLLTGANTKINTQSVVQFAKDLADFSAVTGKSKEDIAKDTNAALGDISIQSSTLTPQQMQSLTNATAGLASLPGETGTQLSKALAQSIGFGGVQFSDLGKELYAGGMGDVAGQLQDYFDKVQNNTATKGDLVNIVQELQAAGISKKDFINAQAKAGNEQIAQLGTLFFNLNGITAADLAKDNAQEDAFTKFFNTLDSMLQSLESSFSLGFYNALAPIQKLLGDTGDSVTKILGPILQALGTIAGTVIADLLTLFTGGGLSGFMQSITDFQNELTANPGMVKTAVTDIVEGFKDAYAVLKFFVKAGMVAVESIKSMFGFFHFGVGGKTGAVMGAVGTAALLTAAYKGLQLVWGKLVGKMTVNAGIVYLNAKAGLDGMLGGAGKKSMGWLKKLFKGGKGLAEEGVEDVAKVGGEAVEGAEAVAPELAADATIVGESAGEGAAMGALVPGADLTGASEGIGALIAGGLSIAALASGNAAINKFSKVQPAKDSNQKMMDDYNNTTAQLAADKKNEQYAHGLQQIALLKEIAALTKKQSDLQHAIGLQTIAQEKKQTAATNNAAAATKRLGG